MRYIKLFSIVVTAIFVGILFLEYNSMVSEPKYLMINDGKSFDESLNEAIHPFNDRLNTTVKIREPEFSKEAFWMKVIFSSIFCIAALYVIITRKYDDETKKWAFSVLTLIAGVWIGTATK